MVLYMCERLSMNEHDIKNILEALLMSADKPLSIEQMILAFDEWQMPTKEMLMSALSVLEKEYDSRAIEIKQLASGYCIQTRLQYGYYISRLQAEKAGKYSRALLETLAIIAWKQPVTRADIEDIRGVSLSSSMMKTLIEREWVKIAGHRDVPGKPAVYVTTKVFLDYFNLTSIGELPPLLLSGAHLTAKDTEQPLEEYVNE